MIFLQWDVTVQLNNLKADRSFLAIGETDADDEVESFEHSNQESRVEISLYFHFIYSKYIRMQTLTIHLTAVVSRDKLGAVME